MRLQVSNWLVKITGKITLETKRELSKFNPLGKCQWGWPKGRGGNLSRWYPIVDVLREAWRVASGQGSGSEAKAVGSSLSVFAWRSEDTLGLPSFIHSTEKHLSSTYLYWVSIMGHMLRHGGSKEINSSSIPWRSLGQRVKCSMKERVWGLV